MRGEDRARGESFNVCKSLEKSVRDLPPKGVEPCRRAAEKGLEGAAEEPCGPQRRLMRRS